MKKILSCFLSASMIASCIAVPLNAAAATDKTETISYTYSAGEGQTYTREMEKLGRGLVAVKVNGGVYLSWRLLDSEDAIYGSADKNVSFNIYRNGTKIATETLTTNYTDATVGTSYAVAPVIDGVEGEKCAATMYDNSYFDIPLQKPAPETVYDNDGNVVYNNISFFPADCSTGDVDGDGEYEIIIKWTSSEHDVGSPGSPSYSGTVRFAAYKLDGTKLWDSDINLGKNVYSSAHTVQFLVYDFDGDGKAEMMCQTSLGSKDAKGNYVSKSASPDTAADIYNISDDENENADFRNAGWGLITTGQEFLTVFDGETGEAIDTIDLPTARGNAMDWGDANATAGNRVNRFVADVAYLDGEKPYAVYLRGYYFGKDNNGRQRTSIAGISFDGERLSPDYRFDTKQGQPGYYEGAYQYVGNGNHNCTVADVDNDGKDEFITGALCMEVKDDNTFKPRWCTFMEHGDALHIGDYDPTHKGLEFFTVHEDGGPNKLTGTEINYGMSVIDADTGEIIKHWTAAKDTGRGMMANVGAGGYYQVNAGNQVTAHIANGGSNFTDMGSTPFSNNFRIFWDGDLYDELLDGTSVTSWNGSGMSSIFDAGWFGCVKINGTKSNPALQADLFGDWREELVYPTTDGNNLRVFSTTTPSEYKIKTLMQDPVYRSGVAAEQTAYNQPPHVGFYMDEETLKGGISEFSVVSFPSKINYTIGEELDISGLKLTAEYKNGTTEEIDINDCQILGYSPYESGTQTVTVTYKDNSVSFEVTVLSKVEFDADTALITGYKGTNSVITIPEYIDGIEVKGISDGAFENITAKDIYIYHNVSIGDNVFPDGVTIHCFEWSTVKEYAESNGIKVEYISPDRAYLITFEESEYSDITDIATGTSDTRIGNITYHPGVRSDKGNLSNSGAIKKETQNGNSYLSVSAKRFANRDRHATFNFENTSELEGADKFTFSMDFYIQENTKGLSISILDTNVKEITNINYSGDLGISSNTWYNLVLSYEDGEYTQQITDTNGNIVNTKSIGAGGVIKTIACPVTGEVNVENYVYFDNISFTSKITSALTVSVTDSEGTPVGDAEITFGNDNDFAAVTDASGQTVAAIPAGVYTIKVTSPYLEDFEQENFAVYTETQVKHITLNGTLPSDNFEVENVNGRTVVVNTPELDNVAVYAAKYNGNALEILEELLPSRPYRNTFNLTFEPDKIFVWSTDMQPFDIWTKDE